MVHLNLLAATCPPSPSTATTNMQSDLIYKHAGSLFDYHDITVDMIVVCLSFFNKYTQADGESV